MPKTFHRSGLIVCVAAGLCLITPTTLSSQVLYGSVVGNVKDASGAAVPGAPGAEQPDTRANNEYGLAD